MIKCICFHYIKIQQQQNPLFSRRKREKLEFIFLNLIIIIISLLTANSMYSRLFMAPIIMVVQKN